MTGRTASGNGFLTGLVSLALVVALTPVSTSASPPLSLETHVAGINLPAAPFAGPEQRLSQELTRASGTFFDGLASGDSFDPKTTGPASSGGSGSKPEVLAGSRLEHQNASIAEIHAYDTAIKGGHTPIQGPGKVTARGPDLLTYDPVSREVVVWDSKYRGPGGSYPSGIPPAKLQKWLPDVRAAIEALPSGPAKSAFLDALAKGRVRGKVFKWPPQ